MKIVDLQTHTNTIGSDGELSPEELINYLTAYSQGLGIEPQNITIAITDHNTTAGIEETKKLCQEKGIRLIPGTEVMIYDPEIDFEYEILCYGTTEQLNNQGFQGMLRNTREGLEARINQQIEILHNKGIEYKGKKIQLTKQEYEQLMAQSHKYNDYKALGELLLQKIGENLTFRELNKIFYEIFRYKGGALYIPSKKLVTPDELIEVSSETTTVLSHPGEYNLEEKVRDQLIMNLIKKGMKGLEVYTRKNSDEQIRKYLELAKDLIITGGSDFHFITPEYSIGKYRKDKFIPEEIGELYDRIH
jgi:predicted metal-dependent phosphoesterase TrpH